VRELLFWFPPDLDVTGYIFFHGQLGMAALKNNCRIKLMDLDHHSRSKTESHEFVQARLGSRTEVGYPSLLPRAEVGERNDEALDNLRGFPAAAPLRDG
jgi:hypothetical protein